MNYLPFGRSIIQIFLIIYSLYVILKDCNIVVKTRIGYIVYAFIWIFILTLLVTTNYHYGFITYMGYLFCPILAYTCLKAKNVFKILMFLGLLNSIALILETIYGIKFVKISEGYEALAIHSITHHIGLFGDPKAGAFFMITIGYIAFLENKPLSFLFFLGVTLFTGVRTATVALLPIGLIMLIQSRFLSKLFMIFILIVLIFFVSLYVDISVVKRLLMALSMEDESNQVRIIMMVEHLQVYAAYPFLNLLFGNVGFARSVVDNGAENAMLEILTNTGFFGFIVFVSPLFVYLIRFLKEKNPCFFVLLSLLFTMNVGRMMLGFSSGIVVWIIIFKEAMKIFNAKKNYRLIQNYSQAKI
jgi:hypothetical protein